VVGYPGVSGYIGDGGPATSASLSTPYSVAADKEGKVYIADYSNHVIRQVSASGIITTFAGRGSATYGGDGSYAVSAYLYYPSDVDVDSSGNVLIADTYNNRIRIVSFATGIINTFVGTGSPGSIGDGGYATNAYLYYPKGIALDISGNLYIADTQNSRIRMVQASTGIITTIAGVNAYCYNPGPGCFLAPQNNLYYFNSCYWTYGCSQTASNCAYCGGNAQGQCYTCTYTVNCAGCCVTQWSTSSTWYCSQSGVNYGATGGSPSYMPYAGYNGDQIAATSSWLNYPSDVVVDTSGNVYVADTSNYRIRKVAAGTGIVTTVVGTGASGTMTTDGIQGNATSIGTVNRLAIDSSNNLYYTDATIQVVRVMPLATGRVSTFAGTGTYASPALTGPVSSAKMAPYGLGIGFYGDMYITDQSNYVTWKVQGEIPALEMKTCLLFHITVSDILCVPSSDYIKYDTTLSSNSGYGEEYVDNLSDSWNMLVLLSVLWLLRLCDRLVLPRGRSSVRLPCEHV
jgi:trimeric autotransporter adhesin